MILETTCKIFAKKSRFYRVHRMRGEMKWFFEHFTKTLYQFYRFFMEKGRLRYTQTLDKILVPFAGSMYCCSGIFQQDNTSVHTANVMKKWTLSNRVDSVDWLTKSPDLNPIDNVWRILARNVYANARQFDTIFALKGCILYEWSNIDRQLCCRLIHSMMNRCAAALEHGGWKINYSEFTLVSVLV